MAKTKLNSKESLESLLSLPSIFGYLRKEKKNTAEHVITKKIFIHARACVNKDFVHSGSIRLIQGKHARYVIKAFSFRAKTDFHFVLPRPLRYSAYQSTLLFLFSSGGGLV